MSNAPTMKDVAQRAGFSAATVSRVLSGEKMPPETINTVLKAVKELSYERTRRRPALTVKDINERCNQMVAVARQQWERQHENDIVAAQDKLRAAIAARLRYAARQKQEHLDANVVHETRLSMWQINVKAEIRTLNAVAESLERMV